MTDTVSDTLHLTDAVYQRLIGEIIDGRLAPGQRIRQAALAERLEGMDGIEQTLGKN